MESVSRLNGILETTHSLTLEAARDAAFFRKTQNSPPLRNVQIKKLLDSRHEREVIEGLRRVIAVGRGLDSDLPSTWPRADYSTSSPTNHQHLPNRCSSPPSSKTSHPQAHTSRSWSISICSSMQSLIQTPPSSASTRSRRPSHTPIPTSVP